MSAKTKTISRSEEQKQTASQYFQDLRDRICARFEQLERDYTGTHFADQTPGQFEFTPWERQDEQTDKGGGGTMGLMKGRVFEKVGVNISTVHGYFSEEFRKKIPGADSDGRFWASGISLVAHMRSPFVPAVHMNLRHIRTTGKTWFGGGADLNPITPNDEDTTAFHEALKTACDSFDAGYYPKYKQACDDYFYLPHRGEHRGVGGIFVDYLDDKGWDQDFAFIQSIGETFLDIYPKIVERHWDKTWSEAERHHQLVRRGRYAEFNLIYDRGTTFGLKTGGKTEAILMSMPPLAIWE